MITVEGASLRSVSSSRMEVNRTDLRGISTSRLDDESAPPRVPSPRSRSKRARLAFDSRLKADVGVAGPDAVEADTDGDAERLACGLRLDLERSEVECLREDRSGGGRRLEEEDADLESGGYGYTGASGEPGSLRRPRACPGPKWGVRDVCRPMAICAMEGGSVEKFRARAGGGVVVTGLRRRSAAAAEYSSGVDNIPFCCSTIVQHF